VSSKTERRRPRRPRGGETARRPQGFRECRGLSAPALEEEILQWWQREDIFRACLRQRAGAPVFSFYEGPPTANGPPGIHHVFGRTLKDIVCRYRTMKGFLVERKAGWDTHGLPVEIAAEKELGLEDRAAIESYGIAAFNRVCREQVQRYKKDWDRLTCRLGYWVDLERPYITFEPRYIESVWWLLKELHRLELLYRGHKIQWYSPGSGTVLSSHEVSLGYREVADPGAFVRFPRADRPGASFLAWTTTPWTLPANAALAVGAGIRYARVRAESRDGAEELILAEERLSVLTRPYRVLEVCDGTALVGQRYRPPFPPAALPSEGGGQPWRVLAADFVSTAEGTGIVHIAPAFGADDYALGRQAKLPVFLPLDPQGRFREEPAPVAGMWFKDADRVLLQSLRERGLLYRLQDHRHNYPYDWRRGTPLLNYPVDSWFVRTTAIRDRMLQRNREIRWHPPGIGAGRFGNWLEKNVDWALSRKRYWGTPLPIWTSDAPGSSHFEVIGSIAELRAKCREGWGPEDREPDLHRPWVDGLSWLAPDGGTMRRVEDVLDVWFDSGAMPFAQWHYPFENRESFARNFPADFIAEGLDQTRGWFYTLHAIAVAVADRPAYRNVMVNGLVLDEKGEKMSKSRGNTADPFAVMAEHGADTLRWYLAGNAVPWENLRFSERGLRETRRKFFNTLENVYSFLASYANIDGYRGEEASMPAARRSEMDRWIVSRLHTTVARAEAAYDNYDPNRAAREIGALVEELSNWYIRRSRPRFWRGHREGGSSDADKLAAYQTTCDCLYGIARLMAPIAPFFGEWLYRCLNDVLGRFAAVSVHLADFPQSDTALIDAGLERRMAFARRLVAAVLLLRNQNRINVRQPLQRIFYASGGTEERQDLGRLQNIVLEEVNVLEFQRLDDPGQLVRRTVRPNFRLLGPRLGKRMGAAAKRLGRLPEAEIDRLLAAGGLELELDGETVRIEKAELEINLEPVASDWKVAQVGESIVALDITVTPELLCRGLARESVNRIQHLRKSHSLRLTDRIRVEYRATGRLEQAIRRHAEWIRGEILASDLHLACPPSGDCVAQFDIDTERLEVAITRTDRPPADGVPGARAARAPETPGGREPPQAPP